MSKFKPNDIVIIYKNTPTFNDGEVGQIIDKDPNDDSYLVAPLIDIGKAKEDITKILQYSKWVSPKNMTKVLFKKPKSNFVKSLLYTILGSVLTVGSAYIYELTKIQ